MSAAVRLATNYSGISRRGTAAFYCPNTY